MPGLWVLALPSAIPPKPKSPLPIVSTDVVGDWEMDWGSILSAITFNGDGTYRLNWSFHSRYTGIWRVDSGVLYLREYPSWDDDLDRHVDYQLTLKRHPLTKVLSGTTCNKFNVTLKRARNE